MTQQNHQSPSGQFVEVPVTLVKAGDTVLWYGQQCEVESVTVQEDGQVRIAISYIVRNATTFEPSKTIHVWQGSEQSS